MLDAYERFVLMYDLTLRTARVETEMPPFREVDTRKNPSL